MKYGSAILRRRPSALSPIVSFPIAWAVGVLLGQIHLIRSQQNWSAEVWLVLVVVPVAFVLGGLLGRRLAARVRPAWLQWRTEWSGGPSVRAILVGLTAVGWAELIHQFAVAGSVPLLSGNIDVERFAQPGGPTVILTNLLAVAIVVALTRSRRPFARESRFELSIAAICLGGYFLQGGRGSVILPIAVALITRWAFWGRPRLPAAAWLALVAAALVAISGFFYLRTSQEDDIFQAELYAEVLPSLPSVVYPLVPVDLAYATNFQTLAVVVGHFPAVEPFGHGAFSARGFDLIFGSAAKDLSDTTRQINPPWTTATMAGSLWADGGLAAVAFGSALIGALASLAYSTYLRTRQFRFALVSSYLLYLALFGVYTSLWTQQPDWLLITPALFLVGTVVQRGMAEGAPPRRRPDPATARAGGRWRPSPITVGAALAGVGLIALAGVVLAAIVPPGGARARMVGHIPGLLGSPVGPGVAVTDAGSKASNSTIYRLERGRKRQVLLRSDGIGPDPERALARIDGNPRAGAGYDVYTPPGRLFPRLFEFRRSGSRHLVYDVSDVLTGRHLDSGRFAVPPLASAQTRQLFVARWGGVEPDLFIVDSGGGSEATVTIRSGESRFHRRAFRDRIASPDLDPARWQVDVFDAFRAVANKPHRADLVMSSNTGSLNHGEEHVLSGESFFRRFVQQRVTEIGENEARRLSFHAGLSRGAPSVISFEPPPHGATATARAVQLFAAR